MPLKIVRNDITKMQVDAIVNAANCSMLGGGGVDGSIHRAAGPGLLAECRTLGGCPTGSAKITGAYALPCKHVIHAVGPRRQDGRHGERQLLESCYRASLELATKAKCGTVAFPLISSGIYGYPKAEALRVAVDTIAEFLMDNEMTVFIVIFDRKSYQISERLFADIAQYIDDGYAGAHADDCTARLRRMAAADVAAPRMSPPCMSLPRDGARGYDDALAESEVDFVLRDSLEAAIAHLDESFSEMLLRKIDQSGMTDVQCYKKANIDRKLFSKIRSDRQYKPSKPTAIAFAIALELSLSETDELLRAAGYALSRSSKFDMIVEFFIERGNYNIFEINEALFAFGQGGLGG